MTAHFTVSIFGELLSPWNGVWYQRKKSIELDFLLDEMVDRFKKENSFECSISGRITCSYNRTKDKNRKKIRAAQRLQIQRKYLWCILWVLHSFWLQILLRNSFDQQTRLVSIVNPIRKVKGKNSQLCYLCW